MGIHFYDDEKTYFCNLELDNCCLRSTIIYKINPETFLIFYTQHRNLYDERMEPKSGREKRARQII